MSLPILSLFIKYEHDTVAARQRARQIARLLQYDGQDQTRIATAVSEIARNAFRYGGGGKVEFFIEGRTAPQLFVIRISDSGPGIVNLDKIFNGQYKSASGMGLGIIGARRLMDQFHVASRPGAGTSVSLTKLLPKRAPLVTVEALSRLSNELAAEKPQDAYQEIQVQNQELLKALDELLKRQEDLTRVNRELEDTNRGVVALYAELDEQAEHLRRADELKSKFLSNMSHEFRSPLNSILALSGLLLNGSDGDLNSEQAQQVGYIRRSADDLLELVNDLLDLAKVEAGKVDVHPAEFRVEDLFGGLRGMLRPLLLNQSVNLVFDSAESMPPLYTDEGKISQILRNFISNALKFTERGEVRVEARLDAAGDCIVFSVADTGIGVAKDDLERIFQDFTQIDNPIQKRFKGTGLGLPLTRKLANLLGGKVTVKSQVGQGSTFFAHIPRRYAPEPEPSQEPLDKLPSELAGLPILIVEDSEELTLAYVRYLKGSKFRPVPARSLREARRALDSVRPSAIILDLLLRGEDAWRFLADLKRDEATREIPVIVVSTVEDERKGYHLGADAYLLKPVEKEIVLEYLERLTGISGSPTVLVIDDSDADRYLLKQQLRDLPVVLLESSNAEDGLRRVHTDKPQLIVLDLNMPGMNGYEALERLKADPATRSISVIISTSQVLGDAERLRLGDKPVAILSKGLSFQEATVNAIRDALYPTQKRIGMS